MNQPTFEKWIEITKKIQAPLQAIAELNVKTLQNLTYIKPEEWVQLKKPEEFLEKQINVMIENSHKTLDYMQKTFEIVEKTMLSLVQQEKKNVEKEVGK